MPVEPKGMHPTSRILLPLDTDTAEKALALAQTLRDEVAGFKVGLELINAAGFTIFDQLREIAGADTQIFYDCKFHDIPNTVAGAARAACRRGVWMFNIHASGGGEMMRAAVKAANDVAQETGQKPLVIAVTILTSISPTVLSEEIGVARPLADQVLALAKLAQDSGCDGIVASPHEVAAIRAACGPNFQLVIPGVRPAGADVNDQKRVMTPGEAVSAGANYIVVGRPISAASDPVDAARRINLETAAVEH